MIKINTRKELLDKIAQSAGKYSPISQVGFEFKVDGDTSEAVSATVNGNKWVLWNHLESINDFHRMMSSNLNESSQYLEEANLLLLALGWPTSEHLIKTIEIPVEKIVEVIKSDEKLLGKLELFNEIFTKKITIN